MITPATIAMTALILAPAQAALVRSVEPLVTDAGTAPQPVRELSAMPTTGPITIDGRLDEPCWQSGVWVDDSLLADGTMRQASAQTYFKVRFDPENLYVGVRADEPNMDGLREVFGAVRDDKVFNDDCIEIWVDPDNSRNRSFHQIFSVAGGSYDEFQSEERGFDPASPVAGARAPRRETDLAWDASAESAISKGDDYWTCELRLPVSDYGAQRITPGAVWALNLARERWAAPGGVELSSVTGVFSWPMSAFADLRLGISPIEVSDLRMGDIGIGESLLGFTVRSPRGELRGVDVRLAVHNGGDRSVRQLVRLDGKRPTRVELPYELAASGACSVTLEVLATGTERLLFRRCSHRRLDSAVRLQPRTGLAYRTKEPFWVDVTLAVGDVSFSRAWLRAELLSSQGRVVARQRLNDPTRAMRLNMKLGAAGREGQHQLRLTLFDEKRELGRASAPIHVMRRRG